MRSKPPIKLVILVVVVGGLFAAGSFLPVGQYLTGLRSWIEGFGVLGPVIFGLIYVLATVLALPGSPLTVVAGALFGGLWGTIYISIASTIGATAAFLVARYVARDAVTQWLGDKSMFQKLEKLTQYRGAMVVAITRLIPLFPFNLLNYGFGLTNVRLGTYVFWSWLCMLPGTVLYVVGVDAIVTALQQGNVPWATVAAVLVTLVVLILLGRVARKKFDQMDRNIKEQA